MKNIEEFVKSLVTIDLLEDENEGTYGHYPFQLYVETEDDKIEMNALALGGDILSVYRRVKTYTDANAKRVYLSIDFPKILDIENDFAAVYSYENGELEMFAIPYSPETGETFERVTEGKTIDALKDEFLRIVIGVTA